MDENDPIAPAVQATEPDATVPTWTAADNPDDQTFLQRRDAFLRTHAVADRSYDEVQANWSRHFQGVDPPSADTYAKWQDRAPEDRLLDRVRAQAAVDQPTTSRLTQALAFPRDIATTYRYGEAKQRFEAGQATGEDYGVIAHYELEHQRRAESEQSLGGFVGGKALELPGQAVGFIMGGTAAKAVAPALGIGGAGLGMAAARLPLQAALTPNIGLQGMLEHNVAAGRDPLDLRGAPPALALGTLQMAAYELAGAAVGKVAPGAGVLGRAALQGATGPFTQQAADLTSYAVGLQTRFGTLQDAVEGKWGDAGKHLVNDVLTNAMLGLMHGGEQPGTPESPAAGEIPPGVQPPAPGQPPGGLGGPGQEGLPPKGQSPVVEAFGDALNHLARFGYGKAGAVRIMADLAEKIKAAVRANPNATRADIAALFDSYADGPVKRFGMAMADSFPVQAKPQPTPAQPQAQQPAPNAPGEGQSEPAPVAARSGEVAPTVENQPGESKPAEPVDLFNRPAAEGQGGAEAPEPPAPRPAAERLSDLDAHVKAGGEVTFDDIFQAAGLTADEQTAFMGYHPDGGGKSLRQLASEMGVSHQTVSNRIESALSKMGLPPEMKTAFAAQAKAEADAEKIADGELTRPKDLKGEGVKRAARKRQAELEQLHDQWADFFLQHGAMTDEQRARYEAAIDANQPPPGHGAAPAQRPAGKPAPVRPAGGPGLPVGPAAASLAEQVPGPPAAAHAGGPPADAGSGQAAGDQLAESPGLSEEQLAAADAKAKELAAQAKAASQPAAKPEAKSPAPPAPPSKPLSPFERQWSKKAAEVGLSFDDLKDGAGKFLAENQGNVERHNAIVRQAMQSLDTNYRQRAEKRGESGLAVKGFNWSSVRALAGQDHNSVFGIDGVAQELAESFGMPDLDPEKLFDMLQEGLRQPMSKTEALQHALDDFEVHQEAERGKKEAQRAGHSEGAAEKALRDGQEDGALEASTGEGSPDDLLGDAHEPGVDDLEHGLGLDFDPSEFGGPHERSESLGDAIGKSALGAVRDFLADESGTLHLPGNPAAWAAAGRRIASTFRYVRDGAARLNGRMFPSTTRLHRQSGEAMARYVSSAAFAKIAAPHYADKVLGVGHSEAADLVAGAVLTERRLRYMRFAFQRAGMTQEAADVKSLIGAHGSPLTSFARYRQLLQTPKMQRIIADWSAEFVPVMEANFRAAQGLDPQDPIDSRTQIPGQPINIMAVTEPAGVTKTTAFVGGVGNLKNPKAKKYAFAREARGNADAYEMSLTKIIENSLNLGVPTARKAEMYRTLQESGLARWGHEGEKVVLGADEVPAKELPNVRPPRGTQAATSGQTSLFLHPEAYSEVRRALAVDHPGEWAETMSNVLALPTAGALASGVEFASHVLNLSGSMFEPGTSPIRFGQNLARRLLDYPAAREKLMNLASIGAYKGPGVEGGTITQQIDRFLGLFDGKLPEKAKYADPTFYLGKFLHAWDDATRLTLDQAYSHLVATKAMPDTETGRRDFINRAAGQYNAKAQSGIIALARATGIGPFATAASQMTINASRRVLTGGGAGQGAAGTARMSAEGFARLFGLLGAGIALNVALWGRWDGADDVPFGAVKVGKDKTGRSVYVDTPASLQARRGTRSLGLLAVIEGERHGKTGGEMADKAAEDMTSAALHPLMGPGYQFAHTALTGKDVMGRQLAEKPPDGGSKAYQNVKAAVKTFNPVVGALTGASAGPKHEPTWFEKWNALLGPFGAKTGHATK